MFQYSPTPIMLVSIETRTILAVNEAFSTITGYTAEEVVNIPDKLGFILESQETVDAILNTLKIEGRISGSEASYVTKTGQRGFVFLSAEAINIQGQRLFIINVIDITDRKEAQEAAQPHQQQLVQADKMASLGVLVSGIAHEINSPNNLIMFNASVLNKFWKGMKTSLLKENVQSIRVEAKTIPVKKSIEQIEKLMDDIEKGCDRIKNIIGDLKSFSRQEPSIVDEQVDLKQVVDSSCNIVGNLIKKSTDNFSITIDENFPMIKGNFQRIEQVLINLITNSCHALKSRNDAITIIGTVVSNENKMVIEVNDIGCGLSKEFHERVFDPFFSTKSEEGGTDLGLSVSFDIIRDHGGTLEFSSKENKGTSVRIILPSSTEKIVEKDYKVHAN